VVVALISILSALAFPAVRKRILAARGRVGTVELRAIAGAQERFRAENLTYLDVSATLTTYYPIGIPDGRFRNFRDPAHSDHTRWEVLGPPITEATPYVFATKSGLSGAGLPAGIDAQAIALMPGVAVPANATQNQWYVVQGQGNLDDDGTVQVMFTASFDPNAYMVNEGE
jgi:type II secretory pathway pseudopilin PulG